MNKKNADFFVNSPPALLPGQLAFLLRHGALWFWGNFLAASLFVLLSWAKDDRSLLLVLLWYVAIVALGGWRWSVGQHFAPALNHVHTPEIVSTFGQQYLIYSTVLSALWGVSGVILFSSQMLVQATHVLLLVAAVIAAMPVLALSPLGLYLQIGVILSPITINLLWAGSLEQQALAVATLLLGALLAMTSRFVTHLLSDLRQAQLQMQEQAHTDPVTQIANRRFFDVIFKTEWRRAARDGNTLALLMVDVDYFKRYNDKHGHHEGDKCLQRIAQSMKTVTRRASDVVARHGGEEFAILLPNTGLEDAAKLAETLRKNVEELRIPHADGALPRIVTVSIGVACCAPSHIGESQEMGATVVYPAMLLNSADRALYRAKRNGRNQVAKEQCGQSMLVLPVVAPLVTTHAA
ncbi:GGDEF domain-containing protein [Candidatus Thiothrix anitrata]|uniref:diguanylate cyclase n=1 Tax=Candidatus Thiothrix anitrata TaxID=2823902 RepID=A0ABX7X4F9_9GAMM|nr:diguanylate cyclase [Candidatus Thiothrix anitrata]QTR50767.1 GGDEF domain-containing protein [Candidatus Thiothrix anitrata]